MSKYFKLFTVFQIIPCKLSIRKIFNYPIAFLRQYPYSLSDGIFLYKVRNFSFYISEKGCFFLDWNACLVTHTRSPSHWAKPIIVLVGFCERFVHTYRYLWFLANNEAKEAGTISYLSRSLDRPRRRLRSSE
jgi:hypothetical protein